MNEQVYRIVQESSVGVLEFRARPDSDSMAMDSMLETIAAELRALGVKGWVVDLTWIDYLNSAGLGLMCNIRFKAKDAQAKLALCGLSPRLMELFRSCCLERLFVISKTRQQALAAVAK
jgi:anti-anti-sigma factor